MTEARNAIRTYALVCVAIIAAFVMIVGVWINTTLTAPDWCARALGAQGLTGKEGTVKGLDGCVELLKIQLKSLAWNSHILFGVVAMCLLVLIVIVIAGGKVSFSGSKEGISGFIGRSGDEMPPTPEIAAERVVEAAASEADQIREEVK